MFDVLSIAALTDDFAGHLIGGRIQRVVQINEATIGLEIYAGHQRVVLVASADSRNPRLYVTSARVSGDPDRVTPLLLLLRKYARGGQIVAVQQPGLERVSRVSIAKRFWPHKRDEEDQDPEHDADEVGSEIVDTHLVIELMGRRSNIILTDDDGRILDAAKRVTPEMSRVRPILPGRTYAPPPPQAKQDPRGLTAASARALLAAAEPDRALSDVLVASLAGFSPQMSREAVYRAFGSLAVDAAAATAGDGPERLAAAIAAILAPLQTALWEPVVYTDEGVAVAFAAVQLEHLHDLEEERFTSMSAAIERYLALAGERPVRHGQRRDKLVAEIREARERVAARVRSLEEERERAEAADRWRTMGEMIYAYIYQIAAGQTTLEADGMAIPLDPALSPSENAQAYFERYRKAQSATANLPELIEQARTELGYLEQMETLAALAEGIDEIEQARQEWEAYRAERRGGKPPKQRKGGPKRPQSYRTERNDLIYVGRNGRQNDLVTFDLAGPDDEWLHARGLPGAHVIIRWAGTEDPATIEQAAALAAYYSGGRDSTTVDVDVTKRRYVRKIKGAGPGMVTYRNERTLSVRPRDPAAAALS